MREKRIMSLRRNIVDRTVPIKLNQRFFMHMRHYRQRKYFTIFSWIALTILCLTSPSRGLHPNLQDSEHAEMADSFTLNVRLSSRPIRPPDELVKHSLPLTGIIPARPHVGPPPQAAILEDDQRRRIAILSTDDNGMITAYLLENIELQPHMATLRKCTDQRQCAVDRMPLMGGLGCVAICLKDILDQEIFP